MDTITHVIEMASNTILFPGWFFYYFISIFSILLDGEFDVPIIKRQIQINQFASIMHPVSLKKK